jgi:M6 family metalloprotease-like protein
MKKFFVFLITISIGLIPQASFAALKAGGKCSKPGAATTSGGKKYVCVKTGSKFVWKKATGVTTKPITVDPVAACKLPVADGRGDVSIGGWPRIKERLKSTGDVIATVVMVDFSDAPATMTPAEAFARISPSADVFKEVSYGKFNYVFKPQLKWYRMSKKSSDYVTGGWTFNSHRAYISEAANLADLDVDFSKTDSLIILANPDARGIGNSGPAFAAIRSNGLTLDGRYISNGATSAYDLNNWKAIWLNHEVTHTLGLVDLYAFTQENSANQYDGLRYTGEFSYMGFSSYESNSPSLLAYERWNLGWLDDSQIKCMNESKTTQLITPVETIGGVKAVMVPISKTKAVVIESRRPLGIDSKLAKSGALVYVVDSTNQSGLGPVKVYPSDVTSDPRYLKAPRAVGEKITIEGVTVTVTQSNESGDTVEVSKG